MTIHIRAFVVGLAGALGVGVGVLIWGAVGSLGTVISYIGIALFLALGLNPVVTWLERRGLPRPVAFVIVVLVLLGVAAGLVSQLVPALIDQAKQVVAAIPSIARSLAQDPRLDDVERLLAGYVDVDGLIESVGTFFSNPANLMALGGGLLAIGAGISNAVTGVLVVVVLTVYFVISLRTMKAAFYGLVPASQRDGVRDVTESILGAVSAYVSGQIVLAVINAVLAWIVLSLAGAPVPFLLALISFIGALIPLIGTIAAALINTAVSLFSGIETAVVVGIYYLVYAQIEAYVLTPRVMSLAVAVPGSVVVVAAIAGGTLGGMLGALVAIPIAASGIIVVQKVVVPRQNAR